MSKVDEIVKKIRNAQAEAIAKNGGITANNYENFENDTKSILRAQIPQQKSTQKNSGGKPTAEKKTEKTAVDKMWDRQSTVRQRIGEDEAAGALEKAKRNTEQKKKELEDYQKTEYDWTDAAARELYEKGQKQKEAEISKAQAEQDAAVANFDRAQMDAMSEEDRGLIDEYIRREDTASDPIDTGTAAIVEHFVNQNAGIDENRLKQLVETRRRELNAQRMQETQEKAQEEVNDGWMSATWANLKTIPANLVSGAMGTMSYVHDLFNRDERYSGLDPNSMGNQLNVYSGAVRGQTKQNIEGDGSSVARKGLGALYQGGMSAADTAARMAAGGALGLGAGFGATVAGLNTFSQTMSDASARGATPEQALALAVTTAGIEAATEKVPLDNLIKVSKGGGAKSLIKNILRQAGIEATEEELSLIGTTLADAAIMQEKSEYNLSVAAYMAIGMTEEHAREQANWDLIAEAEETAIVSGIAGGIGGFGASSVAAFNRGGLDTAQQGTQQAQAAQNQQDVNVEGQQEAAAQEANRPQTPQEQERAALKATGEELAKNAPKTKPEVKTPGQIDMENGVRVTLGVDRNETQTYNNDNNTPGGMNNAGAEYQNGKQNDGAGSIGNPAPGLAGVQKGNGSDNQRRGQSGGVAGDSGILRVSEQLQEAQRKRGTPTYPVKDTTGSPESYDQALTAGRNSDAQNGWCVTPKSAQELRDGNVRTFMNESGTVGVGVAPDGDIVAVFKNKNGGPRKALDTMMPIAIEQGGDRLDCYGEGLVKVYTSYGFEPVARVEFNPEYANDGWTPDKGTPYIYVMMHNGDSADVVAQKMGDYTQYTKEQLNALPTYGKDDYDAAMAYRDSLMKQRTQQVDARNMPMQGGQGESAADATGNGQEAPKAEQGQQGQDVQNEQTVQPDGSTEGMQNTPSGEVKKSKTFTNTGLHNADEDIRRGYRETLRNDPTAGDYEVKRNADTHATAQERTNSPERIQAEYEYLTAKEGPWTAEDVDTAAIAQKELFKAGEAEKFSALASAKKKALSNMGQAIQAASIGGTMKEASDPMTACDSAIDGIMKMKEGESTFKAKGGKTFEQWQKDMSTEFTRIAVAIEGVEDGDADGMRNIIRQIARDRKTTAWFGASERLTLNANRILNKLDFADLKKIANTQLAAMPGDFKRRSKTEIAMGLRKQSMLTSFKTIARNITGNSAAGFMDSFSDSAGGQFADVLLSKITGKRTVGSDLTMGKEYVNAAKDAMDFASLCVELNIPIETDVDASYAAASGDGKNGGKYVGKTFRSQGNYAMRALYAYQKYMSYALEVSDKIFEGGTNAAVAESLARINNSGLTDTDIQELAEYTGNRRTFKDATFDGYDLNGRSATRGSELSRLAQGIKDLGSSKKIKGTIAEPVVNAFTDTVLPFAEVPMNVAQTGIDYTIGIGKGVTEMAAIVRDANSGKEISPARQRQAATDFGRGLTGIGLIWLVSTAAAKGIIAVHNDKDKNKKALEQSEGLSGAQINWSAWERSMKGESEQWQDGDALSSFDFLEPFDTILYLGCEIANDDETRGWFKKYLKHSFPSALNAFMDSPMVQGIPDFADLISGIKDAETPADVGNELAGYAGDVASSFVPQIVRQAAQAKDGYYRDTRGANAAEYAKNNFLNAIPGASETLPKKVNGFGQEQERLGWVSTFFDPTNTQKYQKNEMSGYLEDLSGKTKDMSIYPERQAPMKIIVDKEKIQLTGEQRETYQRTYGEKLEEYYKGLTESGDFERLTDEQKAAALKQAKEYATQHAKAAVSDYEPEKKAYSNYYAKEITGKQIVGDFTDIFKDGKIDAGKLEAAYDQYYGMTAAGKKQITETADSHTKAFLEVREKGVSADTFVSAKKRIDSEKVQPGFSEVRPAQKYTAIAETPAGDAAIDKLMKAYMPDYDPNAKKKNTTELKYDYIRQKMRYSPEKYAQAYDIYSYEDDKGGYGTAKRTRERMVEEMDITKDDAKLLYRLFHGNYKPWDEE